MYEDGDRNSKFFHVTATSRKKVNKILSLADGNDNVIKDEQGMHLLATKYFLELSIPQRSGIAPVINVMCHSASLDDNNFLTTPFK